MKPGRKLVVSLAVAVASAAGLMTMNVALASAASTQPTSDGDGQYTASTAPDFFPALPSPPFASHPCALYTRYQAALTFTGLTTFDTVGTYRGPIQFSIASNATTAWGEGPAGTFGNVTLPALPNCPPDDAAAPSKVKVITGFTASLEGANAQGQTLNCAAQAGWTYQRGNLGTLNQELNVQFKGTCNGNAVTINASIPSVPPNDPNYVASACDSLIAPSSCVYGPASSNF